jgi:hypothetical protein
MDTAMPLAPGAFGMGAEDSVAGLRCHSERGRSLERPPQPKRPQASFEVVRLKFQPPAPRNRDVMGIAEIGAPQRRDTSVDRSSQGPIEDH